MKGFTWRHRVVRRRIRGETILAVHEAYTDTGEREPGSITIDGVAPYGNTKKELRECLERMLRALDLPVLEWSKFNRRKK